MTEGAGHLPGGYSGPALHEAEWPIDKVTVGRRCRTDLGDLTALAASMADIGLLNPITVDPDGGLLAGHRRLEAARSLGWDRIAVRVAINVHDMHTARLAERDENVCRKDFTPSEAALMAQTIENLERPAASERQGERTDLPEHSANLAGSKENVGASPARPRDVAASITGYGRETLRKAGEVVDAENDPELPDEVREVAKAAREEMDRTGKVNGAHRKVAEAKRQAEAVRSERDDWSQEERDLFDRLETGAIVVVNQHRHGHLIAWAQAKGLYASIDRGSRWGNPFLMPDDGDRATVIDNYATHYLPHKPSLLDRLGDLQGKALGCWCAPEPCHGHVLKKKVDG